jgi:pimeloyl-ACP methyl ester carboxylesterase
VKQVIYMVLISIVSLAVSACGSESASRRDDGAAAIPGNVDPKGSNGEPAPPGSKASQGGGQGSGGNGNNGQNGVNQAPLNGQVVLGFFGGFTSCQFNAGAPDPKNQGLADTFESSLAAVEEVADKEPFTIRGCFTADPTRVHYVTSAEPDNVKSAVLGDLAKELGALLTTKTPGARIRLVGHSYGGWTVLSLAKDLDPKLTVDALVTIDPISVRECNAGVLAAGGDGCRRAPTDFGVDGLAAIKKRVGNWTNIYQTSDTLLNSGPMNGADNDRRDYPVAPFTPHSAFLDDSQVIDKIADVVAGKKP